MTEEYYKKNKVNPLIQSHDQFNSRNPQHFENQISSHFASMERNDNLNNSFHGRSVNKIGQLSSNRRH